jgi:S1-C subfamily serine protease
MQKGDVLIRFDGAEIDDLYVFTDALRSHAPGDTVEVVVLREGEEVPLVAVLGSRGERE